MLNWQNISENLINFLKRKIRLILTILDLCAMEKHFNNE